MAKQFYVAANLEQDFTENEKVQACKNAGAVHNVKVQSGNTTTALPKDSDQSVTLGGGALTPVEIHIEEDSYETIREYVSSHRPMYSIENMGYTYTEYKTHWWAGAIHYSDHAPTQGTAQEYMMIWDLNTNTNVHDAWMLVPEAPNKVWYDQRMHSLGTLVGTQGTGNVVTDVFVDPTAHYLRVKKLGNMQPMLTAGAGIDIDSDNVISCTGTVGSTYDYAGGFYTMTTSDAVNHSVMLSCPVPNLDSVGNRVYIAITVQANFRDADEDMKVLGKLYVDGYESYGGDCQIAPKMNSSAPTAIYRCTWIMANYDLGRTYNTVGVKLDFEGGHLTQDSSVGWDIRVNSIYNVTSV